MRALLLAVGLAGCFIAAKPALSTILGQCRNEARDAYYSGDAGPDAAEDVYDRCLKREGVQ